MILPRSRREEGQVYPALLLVIIGGFALAVGFLSLQGLVDQTGRADSASDAAALGVGTAFRDDLQNQATGIGGLATLISFVQNAGSWTGAGPAASEYAEANGASVTSVQFEGLDVAQQRVVFAVSTSQNDKVQGPHRTGEGKSVSRVSVSLTGFCDGFSGISIGGSCKSPLDLTKACVAPVPDPEADDPDDGGDGDGDDAPKPPDPPFKPAPFCDLNLSSLLNPDVKLIN